MKRRISKEIFGMASYALIFAAAIVATTLSSLRAQEAAPAAAPAQAQPKVGDVFKNI